MAIGSAMKELVQGIASSHEDRANRIGEIKEEAKRVRGETRDLVKRFRTSRKELGAELKEASAAWQGLRSTKSTKVKQTKEF